MAWQACSDGKGPRQRDRSVSYGVSARGSVSRLGAGGQGTETSGVVTRAEQGGRHGVAASRRRGVAGWLAMLARPRNHSGTEVWRGEVDGKRRKFEIGAALGVFPAAASVFRST